MNRGQVLLAVLIAALGTGGFLMAIEGRDPVTLAAKQKNSILTAEQVSVSFQGVSGKLTDIQVAEETRVKKGDLIASLDTTDIDLTVSRTELDIDNTKLRIKQREDAIRIAEEKLANALSQAEIAVAQARTSKQQIMEGARKEDIQRQKLALEAAGTALQLQQKTYNQLLNLEQTYQNTAAGYSAKAHRDQLEAAKTQLAALENARDQQQSALEKMMNGPTEREKEQAALLEQKSAAVLEQTALGRQDIDNQKLELDSLNKQLEQQQIALKSARIQKERMAVTAPADGKVVKVTFKKGENIPPGAPIVLLETGQMYFDVYVDETQVKFFQVDGEVPATLPALGETVPGKVRFITGAPQFASLRMSREKGLGDLNAFQVRVYVEAGAESPVLPGMTAEVNMDELAKK